MKSIQDVVNNKVKTMIEDGTLEKSIETGIENAIKSAIDNQFKSFGNITKAIETCLDEGLKINTKELPFETYNQQMLVAIKTKLGNLFASEASDKFMQEMDKILAPAPKEMPFNEFIETIVGFWKTDEPWDASDLDEYASIELTCKNSGSMVSHSLDMWEQKESSFGSKHQPTLHVYIINGQIRINHGHGYNPTCFSETDAYVFRLYAAGTTLIGIDDFNKDDCDLMLKDLND